MAWCCGPTPRGPPARCCCTPRTGRKRCTPTARCARKAVGFASGTTTVPASRPAMPNRTTGLTSRGPSSTFWAATCPPTRSGHAPPAGLLCLDRPAGAARAALQEPGQVRSASRPAAYAGVLRLAGRPAVGAPARHPDRGLRHPERRLLGRVLQATAATSCIRGSGCGPTTRTATTARCAGWSPTIWCTGLAERGLGSGRGRSGDLPHLECRRSTTTGRPSTSIQTRTTCTSAWRKPSGTSRTARSPSAGAIHPIRRR